MTSGPNASRQQDAHDSAARPRQPKTVVIYDGECPFCRSRADWIRSRDRSDMLELVPRQAAGLDERFPILKSGDFQTGMRAITPDGKCHVGADAVHQVARRLPRLRHLAWLYRVPVVHTLARLTYAWIARNRMKLADACTDDTCRLPDPSDAE